MYCKSPIKVRGLYILVGLIFLFGVAEVSHAQGKNLPDSLAQKLVNAGSESEKADAFIDIGNFYLRRNSLKAYNYAQKADSIFRENNLVEKRAVSLRLIGNALHYSRKYSEGKKYYQKSLDLADSLGNEKEMTISREDLAVVAMDQGEFKKAHRIWEKAIDFYRTNGDSSGLAEVWLNRGMTYYREQNFPRALSNFQKALAHYQDTDDREAVGGLHNNIGMVHKSNKDNKKASEYYRKALKMWNELDDRRGIAMTSNNLGVIYSELGDNEKALEYFRRSLEIASKTGNLRGVSNNERNIGIVYHKINKPDSALIHLRRALDIAKKGNQKQNIIPIYNEMASVYYAKGLNSKAVEAASKALELNKELQLPRAKKNGNEVLYKVYDGRGNAELALKRYKKFITARDSIRSNENYREIVQMEYQYNLEQERQKHRLENEKQQAELETQKLIRNVSIGGVILLLVAGILGFRFYRIQQRSNQALEFKNKEIEKQRRRLSEQAENLKDSNEKLKELDRFKEGMTSMLVHDLKNPLNKVLLASQRAVSWDNANQEELNKIEGAGKNMLRMVENILDVYKYEDSKMDLNIQNVDIEDYITDAIDRNYHLAEPKNISLINYATKGSFVRADGEVLNRIFDNLLSNAIKHTPNNGHVILDTSSTQSGKHYEIRVTDNGEGIADDKHHKIFERFEQANKRKSGNVLSTGLGLTFCKIAVEAHGGYISVDSTVGEGTTMRFSIPTATDVKNKKNESKNKEANSADPGVIELTQEEEVSIEYKLRELQSLQIYEVSAIRSILHDIDAGYSNNINQWKRHVLNAVKAGNEDRYKNLINLDIEDNVV